jgi:GH25 family lysozyme M1 (1,4-beta-N-acetylmuramidase)/N-acetyl-anhydromuramyl-L-alanine amidase AmpD
MTDPLWGVDVSRWRGTVTWPSVYRAGIRFAFAKTTEGVDHVDPQWAANRAGMLALTGFLPGAFHFLRGDADVRQQVKHFLNHAGDITQMAVALDVETRAGAKRQATAADAKAWVAEFKRLTGGHRVIGYYPHWYWDRTGRPDLKFFDTVWASHYVTGPGSPAHLYAKVPAAWWATYGGEPIGILQFSSSGTVPGVTPPTDLNAFRGSLAELRVTALGEPMAYPYVQARQHGGKQSRITRLVIHGTVTPCGKGWARRVANDFHNTTRDASAHYVVDPGEIVQCLAESTVGYHSPPNTGSIGFELCDPQKGSSARWRDADHEAMLRLAAGLVRTRAKRWGIPLVKLSAVDLRAGRKGICGHADISAAWHLTDHSDPGAGFPWAHFMQLVKGEDNDMALSADDKKWLTDLFYKGVWTQDLAPTPVGAPDAAKNKTYQPINVVRETYTLAAKILPLVTKMANETPDIDEEALASALLVQLSPERIAALVVEALPEDLVMQVVSGIGDRVAKPGLTQG